MSDQKKETHADRVKRLLESSSEGRAATASAAPKPGSELFQSNPWLIAKKSMLVDVPSSIVGLGGLVEEGIRRMPTGQRIPGEPVLDPNRAESIFSGLAEKHGLLPPDSRDIQPRGFLERAAGVGARVAGNPLTYLPGGRAAMARNLAGGIAGESAAEIAKAYGGGGLAQTGAGFAADSLLTALSPRSRAGFMVNRLRLGPEGASEVATALGSKLDDLTSAERRAWNEFENSATGTTMPGDVLRDVGEHIEDVTKYAPGATRPEVATTVRRNLPDNVDVAELQRVKSAAGAEVGQALGADVPKRQVARGAKIIGQTADAMLDVIAQSSPEDAAAVAKLKAARAATSSRAKLFPEESVLYRSFFGGKSRDNAQEAVGALLASRQRKTEITNVMTALKDTPSGKRAFRRAFVQAVLNTPEELASQAGSPALRKLDRFADVSPLVLEERGAKQLRKRLSDAAMSRTPGNDATIALARVAGVPWSISNMVGGGMASAAAAVAAGASPEIAAKTGLAGSMVLPGIVYISEKFGPRAARDTALEALLDPDLYAKVTRTTLGGMTLPAYTKDLERAVMSRGLHLGLPDDPKEN